MPDFARDPAILRRRRIRQGALAVVGIAAVVAVSLALARMEPAAPTVERATVLIDTVKRGSIVRQVRGLGTLVPEDTRLLLAQVDGQIEEILLRPGAKVGPQSVILRMSNLQLEEEVQNAHRALARDEESLNVLMISLRDEALEQELRLAQYEDDHERARLELESAKSLAALDLVAERDLRQAQQLAESTRRRLEAERTRLKSSQESRDARLRSQQTTLEQSRAFVEQQERRRSWLLVRPDSTGILQQLDVEVGQRVGTGTTLARVTDPTRLKAELRIAETQARDVEVGQMAQIDTRNGFVAGVVSHKDPAAVNGTVLVDVTLTEALPRGAVPDLSVDGTIQLERADNVLKMGRPSLGQEGSTIGIFRLDGTGHAVRTQVELGVSSVSEIQVIKGLEEGDEVILSDMSQWDGFDRVRLR